MSLPFIVPFESRGFSVVEERNVFTVKASAHLPLRAVIEWISICNYTPLISPHRRAGNIQFTVVPYRRPESFDRADVDRPDAVPADLWSQVERIRNLMGSLDAPVLIQGKIVIPKLHEALKERTLSCSLPCSLVIDRAHEPAGAGAAGSCKVLDLGCGIGANIFPFLEEGYHITGIDIMEEALSSLRRGIPEEKKEHVVLRREDILEADLTESSYQIVLCVDVLPYIEPAKLKGLLHKVFKALAPGGEFIGTLFFSRRPVEESPITELMSKMGSYYLPDASVAVALLESIGFTMKECTYRQDSASGPYTCVQFCAQKAVA